MTALQSEIERRGKRVFELVDKYREPLFSKAGFYQRLMTLSMHDEQFKTQLFRFVAVLPSLRRSTEIVQHLEQYFSDTDNGFHPLVGIGVGVARLVPWISAPILRWNVSETARQFIAGRNPDEVIATLRKRRAQKIGFTVDVLGEAVVSEAEADEHAAFYGDLLEKLTRETRDWTDPLEKNADLFPVVNLSVKISAPSGAGKTTLVEAIRKTPNLFYSVSCTTRSPRAGEIDGEDYRFLSDTAFRERLQAGDFLEHAQVHSDYYGTLREPVLTNLQNGVDVLIDIDTQGAATIRNCDDPLIRGALADVFIMPPDLDELRRRLRNRGTETEEQINRRLDTAVREMELWRDYRYTIISGSVEQDLERFRHIMAAEGYLSRRLLCTGRC